MANTTLVADAGTFTLTGQDATFSFSRSGRYGVTAGNGGTTSIDLASLLGFHGITSGKVLGIVASAACYFAFGDSAVTIDTANDVFIPANKPMWVIAAGRYLGLRGVAGNSNVRIWVK